MVWIFFLSTNRNFFQRNQLGASTLGPELQRNSIYLFQIESSGTFLTSHISAMLYHIVSEAFKIRSVPMVWIFFLSTNRNFFQRNQLMLYHIGIHPRTGTAKKLHLSFPNRIFWNFSISHSRSTFPMVWNGTITESHSVRSVKNRIFWNFSHKVT